MDWGCLRFRVRFANFLFARGLERLQVFEAAGVLALDAALIAEKTIQSFTAIGVDVKRPGQQVRALIARLPLTAA
jgi:hypothetical protein